MLDADRQAAWVINDLDSIIHRVEALPTHPRYVDALASLAEALQAMLDGRANLHHRSLRERFVGGRQGPPPGEKP